MKLTLARAALVDALKVARGIVERRNTIPILSNVRVETTEAGLCLTATDLDIAVTVEAAAEIARPGAITLPAHLLHDYARRLPADATISLDAEGDARTVIRSGRSRVQMQSLSAAEFPDLAAGETPWRFALPARDLDRILGQVAFAISREETRYYLNGVYLHRLDDPSGDRLRIVSTDGHRLARIEIDAPDGTAGMPGVILPRKAVAEIRKLAAAAPEASAAIALSSAKLTLAIGGTRLTTKLIDGSFPDYVRVIPTGNDKRVTLDAGAFAAVLDRVSALSAERGCAVSLDIAPDTVTVRLRNPEAGDAEDEIAAVYEGEAIRVGFNARYAGEILAALAADTVEIALDNPGAPMIWTSPADPTRLYVLMPMRV